MYSLLLLACVSMCVADFNGAYSSSGSRRSQTAVCRLPSRPCRFQVISQPLNGSAEPEEMGTPICSCPYPSRCSSDWSSSSHMISRNLLSTTHNMTINMMFCHPVQPQRLCNMAEEALVVSGYMAIPYDIVSINCRCSDSTPLLLTSRTFGTDHLIYHSYVCNNHMPTCPTRISFCAVIRPDVATYSCKCSSGNQCRRMEGSTDSLSYGQCRP